MRPGILANAQALDAADEMRALLGLGTSDGAGSLANGRAGSTTAKARYLSPRVGWEGESRTPPRTALPEGDPRTANGR